MTAADLLVTITIAPGGWKVQEREEYEERKAMERREVS